MLSRLVRSIERFHRLPLISYDNASTHTWRNSATIDSFIYKHEIKWRIFSPVRCSLHFCSNTQWPQWDRQASNDILGVEGDSWYWIWREADQVSGYSSLTAFMSRCSFSAWIYFCLGIGSHGSFYLLQTPNVLWCEGAVPLLWSISPTVVNFLVMDCDSGKLDFLKVHEPSLKSFVPDVPGLKNSFQSRELQRAAGLKALQLTAPLPYFKVHHPFTYFILVFRFVLTFALPPSICLGFLPFVYQWSKIYIVTIDIRLFVVLRNHVCSKPNLVANEILRNAKSAHSILTNTNESHLSLRYT